MVTKLLSASAVLALAGAASAAPFAINTVDVGGIPGGSLGAPITWTGPAGTGATGAAFNPATGGNFAPAQQSIAGNAAIGWDSYAMFDGLGRSTASSCTTCSDGYTATSPSNAIFPNATPTTFFGATGANGSLSGVYFNAGAGGGFVSSGPTDRFFIAQITLRAGSSVPTTQGALINIKDSGTLNADGELGTLRFGLANASNNAGKWGFAYYLDFRATPATGLTGAFATGAISYEIFVAQVPTPGAAGLAGIAGLVALRRRR
ncbi:MAG: hypothetical protein ACKVZJ_10550 [Phycisphaerales bacterium]